VIEFRQTVANFSEPTKELDGLMRSGKLAHDGDPVLAWMIGNVVGPL
jgi:phage terminase large subunit-like protein